MRRVGIEVGGTFTDLIEVGVDGVRVAKVPSTPEAPDIGALNALSATGHALSDVADLVHGSTIATNAVIERKGARVALFVTRGTRDLLALQRHDRRAIYDLFYRKPAPIIERNDIFEVEGRISASGDVVCPLASELEAELAAFLRSGTYDAAAVCLLHSYANSEHERQLAQTIHAIAPDLPVTCSCDVSREFREYERASTTALAAYVQPVIQGYLTRFSQQLDARGFAGRFSVMQSNGGRIPAEAMARNAISALFSGPAAGVTGAIGMAERSGFRDLITLDMGGTSTDVALVSDGAATLSPQTEIDGLPVCTPVVDIATVGAGGGSIAWIDDGNLLRVGPRSAGAVPGPACYGRGGTEATVTDAHLIRGTLQAGSFLGGRMQIEQALAWAALVPLAEQLDMTVPDLADSVIRVAESNIVRAIQRVSTERGHDPRDFVLVPFGGAGPLHAARIAEELGITTVVVPPNAGVFSAVGLLMSDYVHFRALTRRTRLEQAALPAIQGALQGLQAEAEEYLRGVGVEAGLTFEHILEMRYVGQAFEVSVTLGAAADDLSVSGIETAFAEAHHKVFEFSKPPGNPVEIVSFRVGARASVGALPAMAQRPDAGLDVQEGASVAIVEGGAERACALLARTAVPTHPAPGPILVDDGTSTIYVPPGWNVHRDAVGSLILTWGA